MILFEAPTERFPSLFSFAFFKLSESISMLLFQTAVALHPPALILAPNPVPISPEGFRILLFFRLFLLNIVFNDGNFIASCFVSILFTFALLFILRWIRFTEVRALW